jgi:hypothetical protein
MAIVGVGDVITTANWSVDLITGASIRVSTITIVLVAGGKTRAIKK